MDNIFNSPLFVIYYWEWDGRKEENVESYLKDNDEYTLRINHPDILTFETENEAQYYCYEAEENTGEDHFIKQI